MNDGGYGKRAYVRSFFSPLGYCLSFAGITYIYTHILATTFRLRAITPCYRITFFVGELCRSGCEWDEAVNAPTYAAIFTPLGCLRRRFIYISRTIFSLKTATPCITPALSVRSRRRSVGRWVGGSVGRLINLFLGLVTLNKLVHAYSLVGW